MCLERFAFISLMRRRERSRRIYLVRPEVIVFHEGVKFSIKQSEHLLKKVIMKITLCSTFFYKSVTRYKICFPLFEIIILNITSSGDYFDLSNHLHR